MFAHPVKPVEPEPESEEEPSMFTLTDEPQQAIVNFIGDDLMNLTLVSDKPGPTRYEGIKVYQPQSEDCWF